MSAEFIKRINDTLKKDDKLYDLEFEVEKFQLVKSKNLLKVIIKSKNQISEENQQNIEKYIKKALGMDIDIELVIFINISNATLEDVSTKYWFNIIDSVVKEYPMMKPLLTTAKRTVVNDNLVLESGYDYLVKLNAKNKIDNKIRNIINTTFDLSCNIEVNYNEELKIIVILIYK